MRETFKPNEGKLLTREVNGITYLRIPIKTRLIRPNDNLIALLDEYVQPYIKQGDLLFVSEKIVCITQNRIIKTVEVKTTWFAHFLSSKVRNYAGTPQFRGLGHGTAPAMQLLINEAGMLRVLFAAVVSVMTRPLGIAGAFYYLIGKQAKSIDCPMSWTIKEFKEYAKLAPRDADGVARSLKERYGIETAIVDANYRGAITLGKSTRAITEKFVYNVLRDNPAGQDSEMTPFILIRKRINE